MSQQNKIIIAVAALLVLAVIGFIVLQPNETIGTAFNGVPEADETASAPTDAAPDADADAPSAPIIADTDTNLGALETPNPMGEISMGAATAPVTIIEYSSLTCPHCGTFHRNTLPDLKAQYVDKGLVKIYFRPFPFDPYATAGAMLVHCVAPKARVNFLDILFKRQAQWIQSEKPMDELLAIARQAGLSEADFVVCLKDEQKLKAIRAMQSAAAKELGVRSTPTFFINGKKLVGNQPLESFEKLIKLQLP